jgi:hypothetical protein
MKQRDDEVTVLNKQLGIEFSEDDTPLSVESFNLISIKNDLNQLIKLKNRGSMVTSATKVKSFNDIKQCTPDKRLSLVPFSAKMSLTNNSSSNKQRLDINSLKKDSQIF